MQTNPDILNYLRSLGFSVKDSIDKNGIVSIGISMEKEQFEKLVSVKSKG